MTTKNYNQLREKMITQTLEFGAASAGIAHSDHLKSSASHSKYASDPYYDIFESLPDWPDEALSILVSILMHERSKPELDWRDPRPGDSLTNRSN